MLLATTGYPSGGFSPALIPLRDDLWPEEVELVEEVKVDLILNGRSIGQATLAKGKTLKLLKVEKDKVVLEFNPAEVHVPHEKTDIVARAKSRYDGVGDKKIGQENKVDEVAKQGMQPKKIDHHPSISNTEAALSSKEKKLPEENTKTDAESESIDGGEPDTAKDLNFKNKLLAKCRARFVKLEGNRVKSFDKDLLVDKEYIAVYFSASWCGPCVRFTPKLVAMYNSLTETQRKKFELIFISRDYGEEATENYMMKYKMPWPAIRWDDVDDRKKNPFLAFASSGIPHLVLINAEGEIVEDADGNYTVVMQKIPSLLN
ncbi:MAG: thioredoxin-like domain-containing protein [Methylacidiphilales bacterium]|nr:thioredoxin-like domain-containing protein [Candidatus Methylacidiphilales bacterium]